MRKGLLVLLILSMCLLLGCAAQEAAAEEKTLWVVTEQSMSDGMRYQANEIAKAFMDAHPDVTVQLDILPVDADQRELYLYQLRTEILSGGGPDVYLLPTGNTLYRDVNYGRVMQYEIEPLFPDVQLAMVNGLFTDVSAYYDQDSALHTEALNAAMMDAGVLDGRRYVLPIRYNLPVLLANPEAIEVREDLCLEDLAELAVETQDTMLAASLQMPDDLSCFAQVFDYEAGEVLLTQEELVRYFTLYQQIHAMATTTIRAMGEATYETLYQDYPEEIRPALEEWLETYPYEDNYYCEVPYFTSHRTYWRTDGFPVYTTSSTRSTPWPWTSTWRSSRSISPCARPGAPSQPPSPTSGPWAPDAATRRWPMNFSGPSWTRTPSGKFSGPERTTKTAASSGSCRPSRRTAALSKTAGRSAPRVRCTIYGIPWNIKCWAPAFCGAAPAPEGLMTSSRPPSRSTPSATVSPWGRRICRSCSPISTRCASRST